MIRRLIIGLLLLSSYAAHADLKAVSSSASSSASASSVSVSGTFTKTGSAIIAAQFPTLEQITLTGAPAAVTNNANSFANYWKITDSMDDTGVGTNLGVAGAFELDYLMTGSTKAGRTPFVVTLDSNANSADSGVTSRNYVGITSFVTAHDEGGTANSVGNTMGLWYGWNCVMTTPVAAHFTQATTCQENDIANLSTTLDQKIGIDVITTTLDANRGINGDYAISVAGQNNNTTQPGWKCIFCVGAYSGFTPAAPSALDTLYMGAITGGTLYTNGTYTAVPLTGGSGTSAQATIVVSGAAVTAVTITAGGSGYKNADVLSAAAANIGGTGSGFSIPVTATMGTIFSDWANSNGAGLGAATTTVGSIMDFHALTVSNYEFNLPGFTVNGSGGITAGAKAFSKASWADVGPAFNTGAGNFIFTDTTTSGTIASETINSFNQSRIACSSACTLTELVNLWVDPPQAGTNVTATNTEALFINGNTKTSGALVVQGAFTQNTGAVNMGVGTQATNINGNSSSTFKQNNQLLLSGAAPSISSGFGTSPSVTANSGASSFSVNVGTGGAASSGVVSMGATASHGWACSAADVTTPATNMTQQSASSTTTATFVNYVRTTGVAGAWTASDILEISCLAN